jgi:hypothetical protein
MTFSLLWFCFSISNNLFGIGIGTVQMWTTDTVRSLLTVYWNDGELLVDLFWIRVIG